MQDSKLIQQKALLVTVDRTQGHVNETKKSLDELESLAATLDFEVVGTVIQTRPAPDPRTYIGRGKISEILQQCGQYNIDAVLFDHELSPKQGQVLEQELGCMVWDRSQVILEIFVRRAQTAEAKAQVELARLKYMLPRLAGMWSHLDRERGGIAASRGMGEKQINIDRQIVWKRIHKLEKVLKKITKERMIKKKQRHSFLQIGIVGYTNAGKSTLMNLLTGSRLPAENQLFATLDSTTRKLKADIKPEILLSDTVGFIRKLPHGLIASFRSTLDTVREADMLLHVIDMAHPEREQHIRTVTEVLSEIGAEDIPRLLVFNKADLFADEIGRIILEKKHPNSVVVCAFEQKSKAALIQKIKDYFQDQFFSHTVKLPYDKCNSLAELYEHSIVGNIAYEEDAIYVDCTISQTKKRKLTGLL